MLEEATATIRRSYYAARAFWIRVVEFDFDGPLSSTRAVSRLRIERNPRLRFICGAYELQRIE